MAENVQQIVNKLDELNKIQDMYWVNHTLFTWQWWVGILLTIVPWVLWIIIRNKDSSNRLLFVGFFVMIFTSYLDFIGVEYGLWYYEYKVLPTIPAYIPWDFSLFPVAIMLLLQYKPNFSPYIKSILFGASSAFIGEPFFASIKLYSPINWRYLYSFPNLYSTIFIMPLSVKKKKL